MKTKKKNTRKSKYSIDELNGLACGLEDTAVLIVTEHGRYTLENFTELEPGEDYYDPEEEVYQYEDGSPCPIVAYVAERSEHIPWNWIQKILVALEVEVE